jgi:hypothetical protein
MSDLEEYYDSNEESSNESSNESSSEKITKYVKGKYKLKSEWTVYDHIKSGSDNYEANTRQIGNIETVEEFWSYYNEYPKPSQFFNNGLCKPTMGNREITSVSFFKKGILPKWEDPINKDGAEVAKRKFAKKEPLAELDENWFELLLACIGEQIDESITGIRIVDSSSMSATSHEYKVLYRIEMWFSDKNKRPIIEEFFKNILTLDQKLICYKEHNPR